MLLWQVERFRNCVPIRWSRVPLVRTKDKVSGLRIDLSIDNKQGCANSVWLTYCANSSKRVRSLIVLFKWFCSQHGLTGCGLGDHFSGYYLVLMAVFFLQTRGILSSVHALQRGQECLLLDGWNYALNNKASMYQDISEAPVTQLLLKLFKFYASFNYSEKIIRPLEGVAISKRTLEDPTKLPVSLQTDKFQALKPKDLINLTEKPVVVQDPFELSRNTSLSVSVDKRQQFVEKCEGAVNILEKVLLKESGCYLWMIFEQSFLTFCSVQC